MFLCFHSNVCAYQLVDHILLFFFFLANRDDITLLLELVRPALHLCYWIIEYLLQGF